MTTEPTLLDEIGVAPSADVQFFVAGKAAPQGSKRAFRNPHSNRIQLAESSKALGPWREHVAFAAQNAMQGRALLTGAIVLVADIALPRIQAIRKTTPLHTKKPDLDKLLRALGDALTGVVYVDDAQVVGYGDTRKRYAEIDETPGVRITVKSIGEVV